MANMVNPQINKVTQNFQIPVYSSWLTGNQNLQYESGACIHKLKAYMTLAVYFDG